MPRGWLLLFCLLLLFVEPLSLAFAASGRLLVFASDAEALVVTAMWMLATALGIAAGLALWTGRPGGDRLAKAYVIAASALIAMGYLTPYGRTDLPPGVAGPVTACVLVQNACWFLYLSRSRQIECRQRVAAAADHHPKM
jgi:hypothetical protein